ncbi:3,4-dihydroxy-2-butanone-4-phosphate synthase [Porphyromonas miyakawae]
MKQSYSLSPDVENRIKAAVQALQEGRGILLVDDEDRENEGDIIFPTSNLTPENIALMIRECSGIICLCLKPQKCLELNLPQMVTNNTCVNHTAFTISIEAKDGVTTGVSARDRHRTITTAARDGAKPDDLVHPGHVFPLQAKEGGVFERRGHTEGSIDIVSIAGLGDSAVLCELTNVDGTMSRMPEIVDFSIKHNMPVLSIEDIFQYRQSKEGGRVYSNLIDGK